MLRRRIQVVFQDPYASLNPRQSIGSIIREPLDIHDVGSKAGRVKRVRELMDVVALPSRYFDMYPHELSGGLRQRVSIATALALDPTLIVADEPVSALDVSVQAQILDLFESIQRESGISMLFISHDLGVVHQISDTVAVMRRGRIVEHGPVDQVYGNPRHVYTKVLLSAIPPVDPTAEYKPMRLNAEGTEIEADA
jgi:ABC-type glutathione transport system ATPase component